MRAAAIICSFLVFPFLGIGIYCSWLIGKSYAANVGEPFSLQRVTYMFDGFEDPHKTLIVGGLFFSIFMVIGCGIASMVMMRKIAAAAKAQGSAGK